MTAKRLVSHGWAWKFRPLPGKPWALCWYAVAYRAALHEDDMAGAECKRVRVRIVEIVPRKRGSK